MAVCNGALRLKWPVENTAPDVEHCRLLLLAREIVIEGIMRAIWPVIKGVAHRSGFGYAGHVWG